MPLQRLFFLVLGILLLSPLYAQWRGKILGAEYSWDSGGAIPLIAFDGDFNSAVEEIVSSSSLTFPSGGAHVFNIRIQDEDGNWSPNFKRVINFPVTDYTRDHYITQMEYFWDNDPGQGNGSTLVAFDGDFNSAVEVALSESVPPSTGPHIFGIRAKDIDGNWSPSFQRVVVVENQAVTRGFNISNAEYSWDSGTAIPLIAFDGDFNSAVEDIVSSSSLTFPSGGAHVFNIRVQDEDGNWSPNFKRVINFPVTDYTRDHYITEAEYFWDNDPGQGNGFPLIAFDGALNEAVENLVGPDLELVGGVSVFNLRVRDIDGSWSPTFKRVVSLEAAYGCTDETAFNFNPLAFYEDGTCVEFIYGCMDETQFNFNPDANTDDGSCVAFVFGCTDETQFNYNPSANTDDGTCIAFEYGCTDPTAFNYNEGANTDDGTCITDCVGEECCSSGTQWDLNSLTCSFEDTCPADIVRNGSVTVTDLLELLSAFGTLCDVPELGSGGEFCIAAECCGLNTSWCDSLELCVPHIACPADITLDDFVGINDMLTFLIYYDTECEGFSGPYGCD